MRGRGHKRPDGLNPHSRAARKLRGLPLVTIGLRTDTINRLKLLAKMLGKSVNDTLAFLLDNRPELTFEPK